MNKKNGKKFEKNVIFVWLENFQKISG